MADGSEEAPKRRRGKGRPFAPGVSGNPGGRPTRTRAEYEAASFKAVSLERWTKIVTKAAQDAESGDDKARDFLVKILGTAAAVRSETKIDAAISERRTLLERLTPEAAKIATELAVAIYAPTRGEPVIEPAPKNGTNGAVPH